MTDSEQSEIRRFEGSLIGSGMRIGLVCSRFNEFITKALIEGATNCLLRSGVAKKDIVQLVVPGALELPMAARSLARSGRVDAIIALGAVIRGETAHFDVVVGESASGLMKIGEEFDVVVANAVLTTDTLEQAIDRSGAKSGNKGCEAAAVAIEMVDLLRKVKLYSSEL